MSKATYSLLKGGFIAFQYYMKKFIFICFSLILTTVFSKAQTMTSTMVSFCPDCSVTVKRMLDYSSLNLGESGSSQDSDVKRIALFVSHNETLNGMESAALRNVGHQVYRTALGQSLILQSNKSKKISYKLYYQYGLDQYGRTSLSNTENIPTTELDKLDPHELWGFFQSINGQGYVFLNEYQRPNQAQYTMIHELTHLFDKKTQDYIEKKKILNSWSELDHLAVEYRAHIAEILHFQQLQKNKSISSGFILFGGEKEENIRSRFTNRSGLEQLANYVLELNYPLAPNSHLELIAADSRSSQLPSMYDMNLQNQLVGWNVPTDIISSGIMNTLSFFLGNSINSCTSKYCAKFSTAVLSYSKSVPEFAVNYNKIAREKIKAELQSQGFSSLYKYFEAQGLITNAHSEFVLREDGINEYFHSTGGPSPRINGGGRIGQQSLQQLEIEPEKVRSGQIIKLTPALRALPKIGETELNLLKNSDGDLDKALQQFYKKVNE